MSRRRLSTRPHARGSGRSRSPRSHGRPLAGDGLRGGTTCGDNGIFRVLADGTYTASVSGGVRAGLVVNGQPDPTPLSDELALDTVLAASDPMALAALRSAADGVSEDVAVIGFDDSNLAAAPSCPDDRSPAGRGARRGGSPAAAAAGEDLEPSVVLPTVLVIRDLG